MGVRKSQASLTPAERAAFVAAVKALKANGTYDTFVAQHRAAFLAGVNDPAHGGPAFLPWHREYLRRFERALQAVDPTVSLPYWDWTVDRSTTAPPWTTDFMGGNGSGANEQVTTGPFAFATGQWTLTIRDPGETDPFLKRAFGAMGQLPTTGDVQSANRVVPYDSAPWNRSSSTSTSFRNRLEVVIHNPGHMWVGGSMMAMSSPNDPVFWLHHCNVDRLWAVWQRDHSNEGYLPPSGTPGVVAGHGLDDPMRPWAGQPNPPTPRSVLDHHALGYRYDDDPPETISTQHVVFRATDGRVHELWWSADTGWAEGDLATQTSGALAAAGDPAGYALGDGTQHVVYRATDDRIHELWWSADTGWAEGDLATQTSSALAAAGDPAGYALDGTQHVVYRATDGRVHELWWSADTGWAEGDLAVQTSGAPAAAGDPAGYALGDTQHVVYRATDGRVHELWWSADTGWAEGDLATQTSGAPAAAGDPAGYALDGTQHVVYRATDGRVHELWWSADTGWAEGDLAAQTSSAPAAAGDPAGYALGDGTQHVVYRATDDRVHELWWSADTGWAEGDLATQTSSAPAAAGDPAGYALIV